MQHVAGLVSTLRQIGAEIDRDLASANVARARALAHLAATIMTTQGQQGSAEQVNELMTFGEQFYRWKCFVEGTHYWKGLFQLIRRFVAQDHDYATRALCIAAAFSLLGGTMELDKPVAQSTLTMLDATFGPNHPLTQDCVAKVRAARGASGWSTAGASAGPFGGATTKSAQPQPHPIDMTPSAQRKETALALSAKEELSLWITLAFLDIAMADGQVSEAEYLVWKRTLAAFALPDLWDRFTAKGLEDLLARGTLQVLSSNFAALDRATKIKLGTVLKQIVFADGKADSREIDAVRKICAWIGLSITDIP
jgi:uncharacterized tellurite resistance protein B-like protein